MKTASLSADVSKEIIAAMLTELSAAQVCQALSIDQKRLSSLRMGNGCLTFAELPQILEATGKTWRWWLVSGEHPPATEREKTLQTATERLVAEMDAAEADSVKSKPSTSKRKQIA